jgi:hypothetical protein
LQRSFTYLMTFSDVKHLVGCSVSAEGTGLPESGGCGQHCERAHERAHARAQRLMRLRDQNRPVFLAEQ